MLVYNEHLLFQMHGTDIRLNYRRVWLEPKYYCLVSELHKRNGPYLTTNGTPYYYSSCIILQPTHYHLASQLKGVNCASLVLLQPGSHVLSTEPIKRRAGGKKKHIESNVAVYLVLSVFTPRHQQNVIRHIWFIAQLCQQDSSKRHPAN